MIPTVSVLMPVLNEEASVARAVHSVLQQEGVQVEVLVVDGRSVDGTVAVVSQLAARDPRVRLLDNPRTVIPAGLNIGLASSRGDYIARVDGHTFLDSTYFARALAWFAEDARLGAVGGKREGFSAGLMGRTIALALSSPFAIGNSINHFGKARTLTDHASQGVWRAEAARVVNGWDENLLVNEDVDFDHRILQQGWTIGYDPEMRVNWQVRDSVRSLFAQYRRYGRGKGLMVLKNGRSALRLRHVVPPLAVLGAVAVTLIGLRWPVILLLGLPYVLATLVASVRTWRRRPDATAAMRPAALPLIFAAIHGAWGLGMLEGLVLRREPRIASGKVGVRVSQA